MLFNYKKLKRCGAIALGAAITTSIVVSCSTESDTQTKSVSQLGAEIKAILEQEPSAEQTGNDAVGSITGLDSEKITDAIYMVSTPAGLADEVFIADFKTNKDAGDAKEILQAHFEKQKEMWSTYQPDEMYKFNNAVVEQKGSRIIYAVTADNNKVLDILS